MLPPKPSLWVHQSGSYRQPSLLASDFTKNGSTPSLFPQLQEKRSSTEGLSISLPQISLPPGGKHDHAVWGNFLLSSFGFRYGEERRNVKLFLQKPISYDLSLIDLPTCLPIGLRQLTDKCLSICLMSYLLASSTQLVWYLTFKLVGI